MDKSTIPMVTIKAQSIVSIDVAGERKVICFQFDRSILNHVREQVGEVVDIHLEDETGSFTNERPFKITNVDTPNRFGPIPGAVLILDLEQQ